MLLDVLTTVAIIFVFLLINKLVFADGDDDDDEE